MRIRVIAESSTIGGERMYRVQVKGWLFWKWAGYIWAATPEDALRLAGAESGEDAADREVQFLERTFRK